MIETILKRDGRSAQFDLDKIAVAIYKAAQSLGGHNEKMAHELALAVAHRLEQQALVSPGVEQIQDAVETILIERGHARTAKEFILYRAERSRVRQSNSRLMKTMGELTYKDASDNDVKRENANIDGDTAMGTMLKYGSESAKQFYQLFVLNPEHSKAHTQGDIHIHDLDFLTLTTTCCQIDIEKLFLNGFSTGHGFLREPNDIASYSALACIAIQSNQNDQHGGQSIPNFDYGMAPGVAKTYARLYRSNLSKALFMLAGGDDPNARLHELCANIRTQYGLMPTLEDHGYLEKEAAALREWGLEAPLIEKLQRIALRYAHQETTRATYQAMEALVHNLNTMHSRAGAQIPFSSINYGTDISPEGRLAMEAVLAATESGLGNGETPIFPIHIFKVKEGVNFNPADPNYDLFQMACRVSAKRLFPNFSFLDAPYNLQYDKPGDHNTEVAYMGCRTRVMANVYDTTREVVGGRGNLSFTSVNLPRIAIKAKGDVDWFFDELDRNITLVEDQLMERYRIQATKRVKNYPFLMGEGIWLDSDKLGPNDTVGEVLKHGTLTMGFIGLAECLKALIGTHHGENTAAQNLGLEIVGFMRKRMDEATVRTGFNYSLIATPAEGLSGRFVRMDRERFGTIPGVTDRDYYTNSFHIPVYFDISAFDKIRMEAPYHALTNGGHITYVELDGDPCQNLEAFERVVRYMKECGIGYGSINHPVDRDPVCGYTGIIGDTCPRCGRREGEGVRADTLRLLGCWRGNTDTLGCCGDPGEEHDRTVNALQAAHGND